MPRFMLSTLTLALALTAMMPVVNAAPLLDPTPQHPRADNQSGQANTWLEIDQAAFEGNITKLQQRLAGKSQMCAVMKADAYGNGIGLLIPSAIRMGITCIGVASNEEARVARAKGFKGRLMRLRSATVEEVEHALRYNIEELVGNLEVARQLNELA
ncbi:MAG: alanine racemase, partial [Pseudomonas sp.]